MIEKEIVTELMSTFKELKSNSELVIRENDKWIQIIKNRMAMDPFELKRLEEINATARDTIVYADKRLLVLGGMK